MSQIIKAFTGVFMILFMMIVATGILGGFLQVSHAQNFHSAIIYELESSNYATSVIEECFALSDSWGYNLNLTLYMKNGGIVQCYDKDILAGILDEIEGVRVELEFPVEIGFLDIDLQQNIYGYGR